jgi:predicted alpha/beta hydrolase family esterase
MSLRHCGCQKRWTVMHYLMVPGIDGSDSQHWQSIWEADWRGYATRIAPTSWREPELVDWVDAIDAAMPPADTGDVIIVAHSLGCVAATQWAIRGRHAARGLFLAAPPDTTGLAFPAAAASFTGLEYAPLHMPALVVCSEDDPYCSTQAAHRLAQSWHAGLVSAGHGGHLNSASGLSSWPFGRALLDAFEAGTRPRL